MKNVYRVPYRIIGPGVAILEQHRADIKAAHAACFEVAKKYGAVAFRPDGSGNMLSLLFERTSPDMAVPTGFRESGKKPAGHIECAPHKSTKIGREAQADMEAAPRIPSTDSVAAALSYRVASAPMDGYKIYWPALYDFSGTGGPAFLHIPRTTDDGWTPDATMLEEAKESDLWLAMEAHNDKVKAMNAEAADAAV